MEICEKRSYRKTEFLNVMQLFLLGYYNLFVLDVAISKNSSHYPVLMIVALCFSFWARENVEKLWLYFLTRGIVVFWGILIGRNEKEKVLFACAGVVISIVSWYRRIHANQTINLENISLWWLILLLPGYLFMEIYGETDTSAVWLGVSVLFIWLYFLNKYITNREKYIASNKIITGIMQGKEIRNNSNKGMLFFLICCLVSLLYGTGLYLKKLEEKIGNIIFGFFKWLLDILTNVEEEEYIPQEILATPIPQIEGEGQGDVLQVSQWLRQFFKVLEQFLWGIMKVFLVVFLVFVLITIFYGIWHAFYHKGKQEEYRKLKQENIEIQKIKERPKKEKNSRTVLFFRNPNHKIRQLFYTEIKKYQKEKSCKMYMTATELTEQVDDKEKMVAEYVLPYYQRARYSRRGITKDEANQCSKQAFYLRKHHHEKNM